MYVDAQTIITVGSVMSALSAIVVLILKVHKFYLRQKKQDDDIVKIQKENALICFGLSACLDGLQQLGANHTVPIAKDKLDKHLNLLAHEIDD